MLRNSLARLGHCPSMCITVKMLNWAWNGWQCSTNKQHVSQSMWRATISYLEGFSLKKKHQPPTYLFFFPSQLQYQFSDIGVTVWAQCCDLITLNSLLAFNGITKEPLTNLNAPYNSRGKTVSQTLTVVKHLHDFWQSAFRILFFCDCSFQLWIRHCLTLLSKSSPTGLVQFKQSILTEEHLLKRKLETLSSKGSAVIIWGTRASFQNLSTCIWLM